MNRKMSWNEIKAAYPEEWVVLADFEDDQSGEILSGNVVLHNMSRKDLSSDLVNLNRDKGSEVAIRYTGEHRPRRWFRVEQNEQC